MIRDALLKVLACPHCGGPLIEADAGARLSCTGCSRTVQIAGGIPRFVTDVQDELARRTRESFGYEWTHFADWTDSGQTNFEQYFSGIDLAALGEARVLDAGCGMGRHARMLAKHVGQIVAVDFSAAIEQAAKNTREAGNVDCVQGDIMALPVADEAFDFAYSMGVLHHIADTPGALGNVVRKVRPGGRVRIYLYWQHHGLKGALLAIVAAARRLTTRLPYPVLKAFCWVLSVGLMAGVIVPYRALWALGVRGHSSWPLFVYRPYPFRILYNDQFDRFSAPLEQRFDADQVKALMERAGLRDVVVTSSFGWIGEGVR
jgi:SAM-dependent methyltransferase